MQGPGASSDAARRDTAQVPQDVISGPAEALLEALPDGVVLLGRSGVRYANRAAWSMTGVDSLAALGPFIAAAVDGAPTVAIGSAEFDIAWSRLGADHLATLRDASGRKAETERARNEARTDPLTGLGNRKAFNQTLDEALETCGDLGTDTALLLIDLDRFKPVNDTLGHAVGDALLRAVAKRLRSTLRVEEGVFRIGGDEFAMVVPCTDPLAGGALEAGDALARRIVDLLGRSFLIEGQMIGIGASVGIAVSEGLRDAKMLTRQADIALYRAKDEGRGRYVHFERGMDDAMQKRREMEIELRRALALEQFELHYQPQFDLGSTDITGFEALIRWRHPTRGLVPPIEFIELAEASGQIVPMGEWALRSACRAAMSWSDDVTVSVNVSPVQFAAGNLPKTVADALKRSGLSARRLVVEITESVLMQDDADTMAILRAIKDMGVAIAMDDFGTGYSSLSYLRSFPFDVVKVDQSFVRGDGDRERMGAIVRAVTALGESIGMKITAEGVETMEQLEAIKNDGCGTAQGFLIGRPMPVEHVAALYADDTSIARARAQAEAQAAARSAEAATRVGTPVTAEPVKAAPALDQAVQEAPVSDKPDRAPAAVPAQPEFEERRARRSALKEGSAPIAERAPAEQSAPVREPRPAPEEPERPAKSAAAAPALAGPSAAPKPTPSAPEPVATQTKVKPEARRVAITRKKVVPPRMGAERVPPVAPMEPNPVRQVTGQIYRLVYQSVCALHDTEASLLEEVEAILAVARRKNAELGISGALMFNGTHYAQVLEGERNTVETLFETIQLDQRHSDVTLLSFEPVDARLFPSWSMAHVGASQGRLAELAALTGFDQETLAGDAMAARLHELLVRNAETA